MADFLTNLWDSIFTPGTNPTLLVATNATFAALQLLLLVLLAATYSVHFLVLSTLCGGLWWSINWFAAELAIAQQRQKEPETARSRSKEADKSSTSDADDTETETGAEGGNEGRQGTVRRKRVSVTERVEHGTVGRGSGDRGTGSSADAVTGTAVVRGTGSDSSPGWDDALRRRRESADKSGDISTDSEWEKVEGERS